MAHLVRLFVCVALGLWIHMTMLFVAAAHALIFLIVWLRSDRRPSLSRGSRGIRAVPHALAADLRASASAILPCHSASASASQLQIAVGGAWFNNPVWVVLQGLRGLHASLALSTAAALGACFVQQDGFAFIASSRRGLGDGAARHRQRRRHAGVGHSVWPRFFFFAWDSES